MLNGDKKKYLKTIAVTSGKGGVGKTNVAANLAVALRKLGKKVMLMDADLGLSNIDVLLNLAPRHGIRDLLNGGMALRDILIEGPHGIKILPAGSGMQDLTSLNELQRFKILAGFDAYESDIEILLIDTAAGLSENVAFFCSAVQEILIVTSPELTSISDASALINVLHTRYQEKNFLLLVNSVKRTDEGLEVFKRLSLEAEQALDISLDYLGYLPFDDAVPLAVREQKAFLDLYPRREISQKITEMARKLLDRPDKIKGTLQFFIANLLSVPAPLETGGN
jgi:flagellar biosynthesis protein FlhG